MAPPRTLNASSVERLLERLRPHRARRLTGREIRVEVVSGLGLAIVAAAIALGFDAAHPLRPLDLGLLVLLAAGLSRVRLYAGGGYAVPTQLALVPMLYLLPPFVVPVAMVAGSVLAALADVLRGREAPSRLLTSVGDGWHAVGPALVFAAAGAPSADAAHWLILVPALAAQTAADTITGVLREWLGRGIAPMLQVRVMAMAYGVDAMLTPIGFLAVIAPVPGQRGWLFLVPLAAVLAGLAADRRMRIQEEIARADDLARERARLQAVLRRAGDALAANLDADAMLGAVRETASEALGAERALVGAPTAGDDALSQAARLALRCAEPAAVHAGDWHAVACRLGRCGTGEVLAVARRGAAFGEQEREIVQHLAAHAAVSLENARLHARVREQATTDELTGLANHRELQRTLAEHLSRGDRFGSRLSLVLLDIDDFKHVNDTWGHLQGDRVLRAVAQALRSRCRGVDQPARYGGEELAVALPRTDAGGAERVAEELRRAVEDLVVDNPDGPPTRVTVSVGVATAPDCGTTPSALVGAADAALYVAKRSGKNRTVTAGAPVPAV